MNETIGIARVMRWREIGREMADNTDWRRGVHVLALAFYDVAERLDPPDLIAFADDVTDRLTQRLTAYSASMGVTLTEAQVDDRVSALFSAALDLLDTFSWTRRPS